MKSSGPFIILGLLATVCMSLALDASPQRPPPQTAPESQIQPEDSWAADASGIAEGIHGVRARRNDKPYRERIGDSTTLRDTFVFITRPEPPALPVTTSTAIVIGTVESAQSYMTPEQRTVFTEYTVATESVIGSIDAAAPHAGRVITAERQGGAVKFASGRIRRLRIYGEGIPHLGSTYVLFLKYVSEGDDYEMLTAYEVTDGKIRALDDGQRYHRYDGMAQGSFIEAVKQEVSAQGLGREDR